MASLNIAIISGNLGRDAETKFTQGGDACTKFSVATSETWKGKDGSKQERTTWHNVVLWRREKLAEYLTKGTHVTIQGKIDNRSYEKDGVTRYTSEIVADQVVLGGGGNRTSQGSQGSSDDWDSFSQAKPAGAPQSQAPAANSGWAGFGGAAQTTATQAAAVAVDDSDVPW
jgi:single-strand DNA-binding protein